MKLTRRNLFKAGAAALAMPYVARNAFAAAGEVKIYNWVDYIGETTIADFEKATGLKVIYDTYDAAETVEAKVMAGSTGYDIIDIASTNLPRFIPAGAFLKLDKSKLPNWKNLDETILKVLNDRDPGNQYTVPYMWGTTGITVNLDMVKEALGDGAPIDSMDLLFDPKYMEKLAACGVNILESPGDVIPMALAYLGRNPNSEDPADYDAVVEAFKPVRPIYQDLRCRELPERPAQQGALRLHDLVGRLRHRRGPGRGSRREAQPGLQCAEVRQPRVVRRLGHSRRCSERRRRAPLPQLS